MQAITRVLIGLGGLLLTLVAAAIFYLMFADLSRFRPQVEAAVSAAVGRELRIAGEFRPRVLPRPAIVATQITLANADWGSPMPMVSIDRLSATIRLWSLVAGPVRIETLAFHDVEILLEENERGDVNWSIPTDSELEPAAESAGTGLPVVIDRASISNVSIVRRRPEADDFTTVVSALELRTDDNGVLVAEGTGQLGELPLSVNGTIGSIDALLSGAATDVHLEGGLRELTLQADGALIIRADGYELRDTVVKLLNIESRVNAVVSRDPDTPTTVDVSVSIPSLAELDAELPMIPLTATLQASVSADRIDVMPLQIGLGESDFSGSLSVELGERLSVAAKGESMLVDLTPFQDPVAPPDEAAGAPPDEDAVAPEAASNAATESPPSEWVLGEEPFEFEGLREASVAVEATVAELRQGDLQIRNLELALELDEGTLDLTTSFDAPQGGSADGTITLAASGDSAELGIDFAFRDLRLNLASGDLADPAQIPPIGLTVDIRSTGGSLRALASAANGRVVLTQGPGLIENSAVGRASGGIIAELFSALNPFAKEEEYTKWECTALAMNIDAGVGTLEPMYAQSEKLVIVGGGTIDLNTEELNIEFNTKPRSGVGITADMLVTPFVKLGGTLAEPGVDLNASGAIVSGGVAVLTGGMSLLLRGFADRATAEGDGCPTALEAVGGPP